ncbi:hypothetical protein D3C85_1756180 [compost metagenome]
MTRPARASQKKNTSMRIDIGAMLGRPRPMAPWSAGIALAISAHTSATASIAIVK